MDQKLIDFLEEIRSLHVEEVGGYLDLHHYTAATAAGSNKYSDMLLETMHSLYFSLENLSRLDFNKIKETISELNESFKYLANKNLMQYHGEADALPRHKLQHEILSLFKCNDYNKRIGHSARFFMDLYQVVMDKQNALYGLKAALNKIYVGTDGRGKQDWSVYTWIMYTYYFQLARGVELNDTHRISITETSGISGATVSTHWNKFKENGDGVPDHTNQRTEYHKALERIIPILREEGHIDAANLADSKLQAYLDQYTAR